MLYSKYMADSLAPAFEAIDPKVFKATDVFRSLKPRQRKFLMYYMKTKKRIDAWMMAMTTKNRAAAHANSSAFLRNHPEVTDLLYEMAGIGDDDLVQVVRDSFSAMRTVPLKSGPVTEKDHFARLKGVEVAMKLRGKDKPTGTGGNTMNIQIVNDSKRGVFRIVDGEEVAGNG